MGHTDHDRPDDSNQPRHEKDSIREEVSATGQRVKGAVEEAAGAVTGNDRLKDKGDREETANPQYFRRSLARHYLQRHRQAPN